MKIATNTTPARRIAENAIGAVGGVAGSLSFALPAALAGASYTKEHFDGPRDAGAETLSYSLVAGSMVGAIVGGTLGATSLGLTGGLVGAGLGATLAGCAAVGVGLIHAGLAGKETLKQRLGRAVTQSVDERMADSKHRTYDTKEKVANCIRGFRGGNAAGLTEGYHIGSEEAKGLMGGVIDGLASIPSTLRGHDPSQAPAEPNGDLKRPRSGVKNALALPLGTALGVLGAVATAPAGLLLGGEAADGSTVNLVWGLEGSAVGAVTGLLLSGNIQGLFCGAVLGGAPFLFAGLCGWKKPAKVERQIAKAVEVAAANRPAPEGSSPVYAKAQQGARDTLVGGVAGLRAGFQAGYQTGVASTDLLSNGVAAAYEEVSSKVQTIPAVVGGVVGGIWEGFHESTQRFP